MKLNFGIILKCIFYPLFFVVFLWVAIQLFWPDLLVGNKRLDIDQKKGAESLSVGYFFAPDTLEPTVQMSTTRERINNVYEALVRPDENLKMRSSLALSWGLLDDYTWQFKLRKGVIFHDGSSFDADDVLASFERARYWETSEMKDLLAGVDEVEKVDDFTVNFHTKLPEPLLLQKLSLLLIVPDELVNEALEKPVGTGPYQFVNWSGGEQLMKLKRFDDYWGKRPKFTEVNLLSRFDKSERVGLLLGGMVDLLSNVPVDGVATVEDAGFKIATAPTLEVAFLIYNFDSKVLDGVEARKAVNLALDRDKFVDLLGRFSSPADQYVSSGVFGYNPRVEAHRYDLEGARELAEEAGLIGKTVQFHIPKELGILGDFLRSNLGKLGVDVLVSFMEVDEYYQNLNDGVADIYFLGFKSGLGDSGDFFNTVLAEDGEFNFISYENERAQYLIKSAKVELDVEKRRDYLQELMAIVTEEDAIGLPMYEGETIYAFNAKIEFQPRLDNVIYFDEIIVK